MKPRWTEEMPDSDIVGVRDLKNYIVDDMGIPPFVYGRKEATRDIVENGKKKHIHMHREIIFITPDSLIDHKDRNGLHNSRDNLRPCTDTQNKTNAKLRKDSTTGYKGVTYYAGRKKFRSYINFKSKQIPLGYFSSSILAAIAYNEAAIRYFGDFARLNEI